MAEKKNNVIITVQGWYFHLTKKGFLMRWLDYWNTLEACVGASFWSDSLELINLKLVNSPPLTFAFE